MSRREDIGGQTPDALLVLLHRERVSAHGAGLPLRWARATGTSPGRQLRPPATLPAGHRGLRGPQALRPMRASSARVALFVQAARAARSDENAISPERASDICGEFGTCTNSCDGRESKIVSIYPRQNSLPSWEPMTIRPARLRERPRALLPLRTANSSCRWRRPARTTCRHSIRCRPRPPATAGDESTRARVGNVQVALPVCRSSSCTSLSRPPRTIRSPDTAADE